MKYLLIHQTFSYQSIVMHTQLHTSYLCLLVTSLMPPLYTHAYTGEVSCNHHGQHGEALCSPPLYAYTIAYIILKLSSYFLRLQ